MRKRWILGVVGAFTLFLAGCGSDGNVTVVTPTYPTARILSDQLSDGDIAYDPLTSIYDVTAGPGILLFGIHGNSSDSVEYRAFLDFPLNGSTNEDVVPLEATIVSATLKVSVSFVDTRLTPTFVPTRLELITYPIRGLGPADYDSAPLKYPNGLDAFRSFDFIPEDKGGDVLIDVTSLMQEVQRRGLSDFQVRFLLDFVPDSSGFVGLEDFPTVAVTAPTLIVEYF